MSEIVIQAKRRDAGRSNARALRRQSVVPGIYYFHGEDPIPVAVPELALRPLIYTTESHLVRLKLDDGSEKTCVLKDMSFDPITDRPTHFDFQGVAANETIRVEVPLMLVGQAIGQRDGGIVDHVLHKVEIECLPQHMPDHVEVDITNLHVNDSFHVSDLDIPNATVVTAGDISVVTISQPRIAEATTEVTEPEVISKGKAEA
ncbi:MAG: 50S ribosomal protein L25 [Bacteroidetes bacterium]|nr:50S ribosomal protein L25 [Bacteroidota bacterium]